MQSPVDEILLEGVQFYAYHGVNPEERALGQRFLVDVAAAVDLRRAGASDDEIERQLRGGIWRKPWGHGIAEGDRNIGRGMSQIGG